jgi:hypothetical protein
MRPFDRLRALTSGARTEGGRGDTDGYVCHGCERRFEVQYHSCPECGSFAVESALHDPPPR